MNNYTKIVLGVAMALSVSAIAQAKGFYGTVQIGISEQVTDNQPYGNNVAVDADFPAKFDAGDGTVAGISIGYIFNKNYRVEGRLLKRDGSFNDTKDGTGARDGDEYTLNGELKSTTLTIEGFYDFANNSAFTPYVKVGLGVSDNSYAARLGGEGVAAFDAFDGAADGYYDAYSDGDSTEFSWNVGFGANYEVSENVTIFGEYQYTTFGDVETGQDSFTDGFKIDGAAANEITVGVRYSF